MTKQEVAEGVSKKCHYFKHMPFPQLLTNDCNLVISSQHFFDLIDQKSSQTL